MPLSEPFSFVFGEFQTDLLPETLQLLIYFAPLVLAWILAWIFWSLWLRYVRGTFLANLKYTLLELKLPKDVFKSPLAMETVLTSIHNTSDGGFVTRLWDGEMRPQYSLEIVSIEGQIKFYIFTEDRRKSGVMATLYAQYPGIEIYEREDYAKNVQFDPAVNKIWAAEFKYTKPDAYPLKTYVDYGLDKDPKEEFKVDPLVPVLEFLSSVGPNQQVWFQFIVRAHKGEQRKPGTLFQKTDVWKDQAQEIVNDIWGRDPKTRVQQVTMPTFLKGKKFEPGPLPGTVKPSKGEEDISHAVERSLHKYPFDVGIRTLYIAKKDVFNTPFGIGGCISSMKQFSSEGLNGLRPNGDKWIVQFDEPWKDYKNMRRNHLSRKVLMAYRRRNYFHPPFESVPLIMNAEALATLYHLPGAVAATPGLERVPSKKAEAPANLPI